MSDDLDFDMEIVGDDELDELSSDGASSLKEDPSHSETGETEEISGQSQASSNKSPGSESETVSSRGEVEGWKRKTLGNIFNQIYSGGTPKKGVDEYYEGDLPFVKIEDLNRQQGRGISTAETHITERAVEETSARAFQPGTLLLTIYGSLAETALVRNRVATNQAILGLWGAEEENTLYAKYAIDYDQAKLQSLSRQTTQANLGKGIVAKHRLPVPPLPEQRKIASVLYAVDQAIQKTEAIIEQAKRVKRGLVQDLFTHGLDDEETQRIRPGDFPKSWKVKTLGEVANVVRGNTPDTKNENYYGGENVWITPNDLSNLYEDGVGKYIADSERKLTDSGVEDKSLSMVRPNSVMFTSRSYGIGKTAICTVPAATNQGITAFECESELREEFLYYYLNHTMNYIVSISGVATFPEITKRGVEGLPIPVPDPSTQEAITSPLSRLDDLIDHEIESKEELKQLKKGLMQDLLTGEVRTADKAIEVLDEVAAHG